MRLFRLAQLLELKYQIKALASLSTTIDVLKDDIVQAYNHYVNSDKAKEPILQILANAGEPFSKNLVFGMEELVANLDKSSMEELYTKVKNILDLIKIMKEDPENTTRNFIHNSVRATKQSEKNYREHVKSKFEMVVTRLSSILSKQAKILAKIVLQQDPSFIAEPIRKELSKQKILNFLMTPVAENYGLTSLDVWEKVSSYPDLKHKLTTLINAIDRGQYPVDGPEIKESVAEIMEKFKARTEKDNSELFSDTD